MSTPINKQVLSRLPSSSSIPRPTASPDRRETKLNKKRYSWQGFDKLLSAFHHNNQSTISNGSKEEPQLPKSSDSHLLHGNHHQGDEKGNQKNTFFFETVQSSH